MKTSSFKLYTGPGRISIARYAPRGAPEGFRIFKGLAPGPWFNSVPYDEYLHRYNTEILHQLDTQRTWDALHFLAGGAEPVLLCWESPPFTAWDCCNDKRANWCHRRIVAEFFERTLGVEVPELDVTAAPR
jgi:hypothetical protein